MTPVAIFTTAKRREPPAIDEWFDGLFRVALDEHPRASGKQALIGSVFGTVPATPSFARLIPTNSLWGIRCFLLDLVDRLSAGFLRFHRCRIAAPAGP